jgi:hypothetical protein
MRHTKALFIQVKKSIFFGLGIFLDVPEPLLPGVAPTVKRFNSAGVEVDHFRGPEIEIRALVEGQALCMRAALEAQLGNNSSKSEIS